MQATWLVEVADADLLLTAPVDDASVEDFLAGCLRLRETILT